MCLRAMLSKNLMISLSARLDYRICVSLGRLPSTQPTLSLNLNLDYLGDMGLSGLVYFAVVICLDSLIVDTTYTFHPIPPRFYSLTKQSMNLTHPTNNP